MIRKDVLCELMAELEKMTKSEIEEILKTCIEKEEKYAIPTREDWEELESQLNCKFPETFKAFIELMSEYLFPGDIYNVLKENNNGNDTILYVYKYEAKYSEWDKNMIPFWGIGNGDYFCICKTNNKIYYSNFALE